MLRSALVALMTSMVIACGDPPAPAPSITPEPPPSTPSTVPEPVAEPTVEPPAAPAPAVNVSFAENWYLPSRRWGDGPLTAMVELPGEPRPEGPVVAYAEGHHSYWALREIAAEPTPTTPIVVVTTYPTITMCETHARRARRLHATHIADESGEVEELAQTTYLALELEGCPGRTSVVGVPRTAVTARWLRREALTDRAPVELVDLVREADSYYVDAPAAADYRMLTLPQLGLTIVVGNTGHLVRDGLRLNERYGGMLDVVIEAGGRVYFEASGTAEDWSSPLECFTPTYAPGSCEVTDASGTPTNVRGGPSGRSPVVGTVSMGATLVADDRVGSWFHVRSTPAGWVHQSAVTCTELAAAQAACP